MQIRPIFDPSNLDPGIKGGCTICSLVLFFYRKQISVLTGQFRFAGCVNIKGVCHNGKVERSSAVTFEVPGSNPTHTQVCISISVSLKNFPLRCQNDNHKLVILTNVLLLLVILTNIYSSF
jgi:hypothetical protein